MEHRSPCKCVPRSAPSTACRASVFRVPNYSLFCPTQTAARVSQIRLPIRWVGQRRGPSLPLPQRWKRSTRTGSRAGGGQPGQPPEPAQQHPCRKQHPRGGSGLREAQQFRHTPPDNRPEEGKGTIPAALGTPRGQEHPSHATSLSSSRGSSRRPHASSKRRGAVGELRARTAALGVEKSSLWARRAPASAVPLCPPGLQQQVRGSKGI